MSSHIINVGMEHRKPQLPPIAVLFIRSFYINVVKVARIIRMVVFQNRGNYVELY